MLEKLDHIDNRLMNLEVETRAAWKGLGQKLDTLLLATTEGAMPMSDENVINSKEGLAANFGAVLERKRLKERLKDAAAAHDEKVDTRAADALRSLSERIFGIRAADARAGKERSRSLAPPETGSVNLR